MRLLLPALLLAAFGLAGCTTDRSGGVGDTLQAKTISARLIEVDRHPKADGGTFSTPASGTHFVGVDVGLCNKHDAAVIAYHFQLKLSDGSDVRPHFPQSVYSRDFDTIRSRCGRGWIVFDVPDGVTAKALDYRYDGTDGSSQYNHPSDEHDHFVWSL